MSKRYIAIKIDVVSSRRSRNRAALQEQLFQAVEQANTAYRSSLASQFIVTHGDEAQGMLSQKGAAHLLPALEAWMDTLRPYRLRFGVGIGAISTPLQPQAVGMDGEAWHLAKEAVETAHKERKLFQLSGYERDTDLLINALGNLTLALRQSWTGKQLQAANLALSCRTHREAATRMNVQPATFSKHLSAANWQEYRDGREAFIHLMKSKHPPCLPPKLGVD